MPARAGIVIDFYAGLTGGMGAMWADSNSHSSQAYGAVLGLDIPLIRAEGEYNYLRGGGMNIHLGMLNGYLKMPTPVIQPYMGVGVGQVFGGTANKFNIQSTTAYQAMIGVQIDMPATPVLFDVETRALRASDIAPGVNLFVWDARLKLRWMF